MLDQISRQPALWNALRWLAEAGYRGEHAAISRELAPWKQPDQRRFLDFGCGTGAHAHCFPADAYVGVDLSTVYLAYARRTLGRAFLASNGDGIGLRADSFDAGLVIGVIHHLDDGLARATFKELRRVLRGGSTLLVMEDIPPPGLWNLPGHALHWLDRGGYIRDDAAYRALFRDYFEVLRSYPLRSGICDYQAYVLEPTK